MQPGATRSGRPCGPDRLERRPLFVAQRGIEILEGSAHLLDGIQHVRYIREIHLGDPVQVTVYLLAADEKRLHTFEELRHATEGWISATSENITLHIDMAARKVAPFPSDIRARIADIANVHAAVPRPEGIGRKVAMPSK